MISPRYLFGDEDQRFVKNDQQIGLLKTYWLASQHDPIVGVLLINLLSD
jgi:hypothetical protein